MKLHDLPLAEKNMLSALDFAEKSNDLISIGCAYRGLGEILKASEKAEDAAVRRYLRCRRSKRTHVKITSYINILMFTTSVFK